MSLFIIENLSERFEKKATRNNRGFSANASIPTYQNETVNYSKFSCTNGYGQLSKAGAVVTKGVTGKIAINLEITSFSEESYEAVTDEIKNTVSHEMHEKMQESIKKQNYSDWWFCIFSKDSSSSETLKTKDKFEVSITDTVVKKSLEKHMKQSSQRYNVSGEFTIIGQAAYPTEVFLFIETLTIQTSDGSQMIVFNNNTALADKNGNTGCSESNSKLNITPLF